MERQTQQKLHLITLKFSREFNGRGRKGFPYIMQHFALERLIMAINGHARAEYAN
jgi:hypothetical protein